MDKAQRRALHLPDLGKVDSSLYSAIFLSSLDEGEDSNSFYNLMFNFLFVSMRFDIKHNMNTVNKV